jgi:hypothetical protein
MKFEKFLLLSVVVIVCVTLSATFAQGQAGVQRLPARHTVKRAPSQTSPTTSTAAGTATAAASATPGLPLWTFNVESNRDDNEYTGVMVGTSPFEDGSGQTSVTTQVVPIVIRTHTIGTSLNRTTNVIATTPGDTTFNPTRADRSCLGSRNNNPLRLFLQSPLLQTADFNYGGTDVGTTQGTDAFQRANFWKVIDHANYHVTLGPITTFDPIVIDIPAASGLALATTALGPPAFCAPMGIIDINLFDLLLNNNVLPVLAAQGVNHGTFPIFFLHNLVMSIGDPTNLGNCCVLGYHGTGNADPTQTYSPLDFDSTGLFGVSGLDTAVASHEIAEWMNDPFGNNPTPSWGHTGQVGACQNNLEVGDPLTGTEAPRIAMPNGFTYHLQELAFFSWFYNSHSVGVNGWFSDNGTFLTDAGPPCT